MNHPETEKWMTYLYESDEMGDAERSTLDEHLAGCTACRDQVLAWQRTASALDTWDVPTGNVRSNHRWMRWGRMVWYAAAACVLLVVGIGIGRVTGPQPVDVNALQGEIAAEVRGELEGVWEMQLASAVEKVKSEMTDQYRDDLNLFAMQTLNTSTALTNGLLEQLIHSINAAQKKDRKWVLTALDELESERQKEAALLRAGLNQLAVETGNELVRTKAEIYNLLQPETEQ